MSSKIGKADRQRSAGSVLKNNVKEIPAIVTPESFNKGIDFNDASDQHLIDLKSRILNSQGKIDVNAIKQIMSSSNSVEELIDNLSPGLSKDPEMGKLLDDNAMIVSAINSAIRCSHDQDKIESKVTYGDDPVKALVEDNWLSNL